MSKTEKKPLPAKSLAKGLEILEFVATATRSVRLKDISDAFEMDMASTHRVLKTLEEMDYISRLPIGKAYGPGERLKHLVKGFTATREMTTILRPIVRSLTEKTGQVAHIGILQDSQCALIEVAITDSAKVSVRQAAGDLEDLYYSAIGKAILAFLPKHEQNALIRLQSFERFTDTTIKSASGLRRELEQTRKSKLAFDNREWSGEVACIAAPILDETGVAIAAIGISMVADQHTLSPRENTEFTQIVLQAAQTSEDALKC